MNRITVVVLALAILLAHTLAIHQTPSGDFAPPYDRAHVAYRIGRNLVHEGRAAWDTVGGVGSWSEAYPSALWVGLSALAERLFLYPTWVTQTVGILASLITIVVLSQFSSNRMAGLIAPVLFAVTGATAAAGASGTEAPLAMLLATTAFLAFERGMARLLVVALVLLCLCRPEGMFLFHGILLLELLDRPFDPLASPERPPRRSMKRPLALVFVLIAALTAARGFWIGEWVSPFTAGVLAPDAERAVLGLAYMTDFFRTTPAALLLLLPLVFLVSGKATGTGRRALLLFALWVVVLVANGGDGLPLWNALSPALPLAFLSIQSEITGWLDRTPRHSPVAFCVLLATIVASLFASKLGDLGPIPLKRALELWMQPSERTAAAYPRRLGRLGLLDELRNVEKLRNVGIFLRDKVPADARISTFWPGAIGYLSRKQVFDLLGRTQPPPGSEKSEAWHGEPRVDLVRAFEETADYVVPTLGSTLPLTELLHHWLQRYDLVGDTQERFRLLTGALRRYEVVTVPIPASEDDPEVPAKSPFLLLRNRGLDLMPRIELRLEDDDPRRFVVDVRHAGHRQVVNLSLQFVDPDENTWNMRPTGEWTRELDVDTRTSVLVYDSGQRPIRMVTGELPAEAPVGRLFARLRSPGIPISSIFATAGEPVSIEIGR